MVTVQHLAPSLRRRFHVLFGSAIEIIWIAPPALDLISGDLVWIENIVFEMGVRARAALPFGGRLVVEWANIQLEANVLDLHLDPGHYVMLELTCMREDPENLNIQEPFTPVFGFSSVDCRDVEPLILSLGGCIYEYNEPGRGLTIRAFFPCVHVPDSAKQDLAVNNDQPLTRILLVEDEGLVRDVACEILELEGYEVFVARTAKDAVRIFEEEGPVHLLLTDLLMPGMDGEHLSRELKALNPRLKTIYMSGYTESWLTRFNQEEVQQSFLQKPFTMEALTAKVKEVLARTAI